MLMPATAELSVATPAPRLGAEAEPFLAVEHVAKRYGATTVLDDIELTIGSGEFLALLGPSGCGKTTLLRILCGIEQADGGRIRMQGQDIGRRTPAERGFGVVFQSYALFPNLTAGQNVGYGLHGLARERRDRRVREMLDLVGLGGHESAYPAQLSGGQQQRVALARALAPSPRMILLDEPLSALDAQVRAHLRGEITRICRHLGVTTVMVTHDQEEALSMADRVVLMHRGRIEQATTPTRLYAAPRSAFAASFVGRMNVWPGKMLGLDSAQVGSVVLDCAAPHESIVIPGREVRVGIRPEHVHWVPHEPALDRAPTPIALPANTVLATVQALSFHGSRFGVRLQSEDLGGDIELDMPTPPGAEAPLAVLERVKVVLPPHALFLLPADR